MKKSKWSWDWDSLAGILTQYLLVVLVAPAVMIGLIAIIITVIGSRKTISVPVEFCRLQETGRTQTRIEQTYMCASYDSKSGACTIQVPQTNTYVDKEVRVTCDFTEWK
jgi:hypothetical protein